MEKMIRPRLGVNIDHVATIRQARGTRYPDPVAAASLAELAGADQITVHLRGDRRHIQDRDVQVLRQSIATRLNLEMAATDEMLEIALATKPLLVTLVPENREERTTEGGLDVAGQLERLTTYVTQLKTCGAHVSMFIDPEANQIEASHRTGAEYIELHTGDYCRERDDFESVDAFEATTSAELQKLAVSAKHAHELGLRVAAGHGLTYENVIPVAAIPYFEEFNIGHSIVARAVFVGFERAVSEMRDLLERGRLSY